MYHSVRDILLKVEADPELDGSVFKTFDASDFGGHSDTEVTYHIDQLFEAGFVHGIPNGNPKPAISRLTWEGHEFIAATKDPRIWESVMQRLKGWPDAAISIVWEIAKAEGRKHFGLP